MAASNDNHYSTDFFRWDGMQRYLHPLTAPFSESRLLINWTSDIRQAKRRRGGYLGFLDTPDTYKVLAIIPVNRTDGTPYVLRVTTHGIRKFIIGSGSSGWGAEIYTWPNTITQVTWAYHALVLSLCTDTNNLTQTQDGAVTFFMPALTGLLNAKPLYCEVYQDRLYLANFTDSGTGNPLGSYLVASKVGDPTTWTNNANDATSAQFYYVDRDHNGSINQLCVANNRLTIWKAALTGQMAQYRFDGDSIVQVPTDVSIRPGGAQTFAMIDGFVYFTNNAGIQEYAGDRPQIKSLAYGDLGKSLSPQAGIAFDRKYWCSLSSSIAIGDKTISNPIVVYDRVANEVYLHSTADWMTCWTTFATSSAAAPQLYSGDSVGNTYIWSDSYTTDNGVPIHAELETRYFFGHNYNNYMNFQTIWAYADPAGMMKIATRCTGQDSWNQEQEMTEFITRLDLPAEASRTYGIRFRITSDTTGAAPVFLGFSIIFDEGPAH